MKRRKNWPNGISNGGSSGHNCWNEQKAKQNCTLLFRQVQKTGSEGKHHLSVGPWTTLIVLAHIPSPAHERRIVFLEQQVNQAKAQLTAPNASIGRVVMGGFQNEVELGEKLRALVRAAIGAQ